MTTHVHRGTIVSFNNQHDSLTFWGARRQFLRERGYALQLEQSASAVPVIRERLPSNGLFHRFESAGDSQDLLCRIYATRISDNRPVCIKIVGTRSYELLALKGLHRGTGRFDPENHCVQIIEVFADDERREMTYIVMPALHPVSASTFKRVSDVVEFTSQVLLGLHYMRRNYVAHRDCSLHNIMLEARAPPASIRSPPSPLKQASRTLLQLVRGASNNFTASRATYYFVGFRGAIACSPDYKFCTDSKNFTTDKEPPEFWHEYLTFYDPLLLDVFLIGNMLRREFLDKYSNVEFLQDLIQHMVEDTPEERKDASGALRTWFGILPQISSLHRAQRLHPRGQRRITSIVPMLMSRAKGIARKKWNAAATSDDDLVR